MKKYLITGFSGFVAPHFLNYLESLRENCQVLGVDINSPDRAARRYEYVNCAFRLADLGDKNAVGDILKGFQPDYVLHLASFSSVAYSWKNPVESFVNNSNIFLNLVDRIRLLKLPARILSIGSSEQYGNVAEKELPLREELPPQPRSPYAIARVSQEMLSQVYARSYGVDIVLTRSFNHIGPGQKDVFVISAFAGKLAAIEKNADSPKKITVGDLTIIRDFVDVRDVVRAYHQLLLNGETGEIYNVCSETGCSLADILRKMMRIINVDAEIIVDEKLFRPDDNRRIIGSNQKIRRQTGWQPSISIEESLRDVIDYWRAKV